jgi:hypothetical protein
MKTILVKYKDSTLDVKVDNNDYERLMKYKWGWHGNKKIYISRKNHQGTIIMHREIVGLKKGDKLTVDHINGDTLDNRKVNLRICSYSENNANTPKQKNGKLSKYKGVTKQKNRYRAEIRKNNVHYYLGSFIEEHDAAISYNNKATELFGKFARINLIEERGK